MSFRAVALLAFLAAASVGCGGGGDGAPPPPADQVPIRLERVFPALSFERPLAMLQAPNHATRWFVVEQAGRVRAFSNDALAATTTLFLDITSRVELVGEMGLLGLAFHPLSPANDPRVFAFYSHRDSQGLVSRLSEFRSTDGGSTLDANSERILLTIRKPKDQTNHNGGGIAFGPGNFLYAGIGDGGGSFDQHGTIGNAQTETNLLGKILRIDVSSGVGYGIPGDNPFVSSTAFCGTNGTGPQPCPEIFAMGLRNPWRWSFDRLTQELWVADVGEGLVEEVNRVSLRGNYGWRCFEGTSNTGLPCGRSASELSPPVAEYGRDQGASVTGGYVYRGTAFPRLVGRYVFGDFVSGTLFNIPADQQPTLRLTGGFPSNLNISSFAESLDGELFAVDYGGGLYRVAE